MDEVLPGDTVALLAEGVDRNLYDCANAIIEEVSPSSRRAWIEIQIHVLCLLTAFVALLAEGVDRNSSLMASKPLRTGRPPRGGRG